MRSRVQAKKSHKWLWWVLLLVAIVVGGFYFVQHGQSHIGKPQTVRLVALGDSLTYGVGDQKKQGGYVSQIKTKLEAKNNVKVKTANFGVSGNRSDQIEKRLKTQTKFQTKLKNADVIVMTVGGNDLFQKLQQEMFVSSTQTVNQDMAKALTTYQTKLTSLMHEIRHYNSKSPIFLYSIYNPVYVYFANVSLISKSVAQLNQVDQSVIKADGNTYFVDINHALSDGQYTTKAKRQKLLDKTKKVNQSSLDLSQYNEVLNGQGKSANVYISNADHFHPNHKGYGIMTNHLYRVMMDHKKQWEN